jgi:hypothetical protein|tara:strand:+ start:1477 stop:1644 length:168 start_codon:yes stop_codon:yes gene_type:complete
MTEIIKHLFGFCGEPHGFLYYLLFGGTMVSGIITYIKSILERKSLKTTRNKNEAA